MAKIKRALVLSGGSIKGAFQAGAIEEIMKSKFKPDVIYGVSVGALNGAYLAGKMGGTPGMTWPGAAQSLVQFWTDDVTSFDQLGRKRKGLGFALKILCNKFSGFLDMEALKTLIKKRLDVADIAKSPAPFFPGIVDLEEGKFFYATANEKLERAGGGPKKMIEIVFSKDHFIDLVIASTREPVKMDFISFNPGETLIDGGVRNIAPLKSAIDDGAKEIITISAQTEEVKPQSGKNYRKLLTLAGRAVGIMTNEIVNNDLKLIGKINLACLQYGKKADGFKITGDFLDGYCYIESTVIRPENPLDIDITTFTPADIARIIEEGRKAAKKALKDRDAFRKKIDYTPWVSK